MVMRPFHLELDSICRTGGSEDAGKNSVPEQSESRMVQKSPTVTAMGKRGRPRKFHKAQKVELGESSSRSSIFKRPGRGRPRKIRNSQMMERSFEGNECVDLPKQPLPVGVELGDSSGHNVIPKRGPGRPRKSESLLWMDVDYSSLPGKKEPGCPKTRYSSGFTKRGPGRPRKTPGNTPKKEHLNEECGQVQDSSQKFNMSSHREDVEHQSASSMMDHSLDSSAESEVQKKGDLQCVSCDFQTKVEYVLKWHVQMRHQQSLDESPSFKCPTCDFETHMESYLERHIIKHIPENWLKCPECDFAEEDNCKFYNHYLHHGESTRDVYPCPFCSYSFRNKAHVARHVTYHRKCPYLYDCGKCDFSTTRLDHLQRHNSLHHPKSSKKSTQNRRST